MKTVLKWLCVLPAAIGAFALTQLLLVIASIVVPGPLGDIWTQFVGSVVCPVAFVMAGARVAPNHKFITALILNLMLAVVGTALYVWLLNQHSHGALDLWWTAICGVAGLLGGVGVCVHYGKSAEARKLDAAREQLEAARAIDRFFRTYRRGKPEEHANN